jgi:hypothetical protein
MSSSQKKVIINLAVIGLLVAVVLTLRKLGIAEVLEPEWVDTLECKALPCLSE